MATIAPQPAASGLNPPPPGRKLTTIDLIGGILCHVCNSVLGNKKEFDSHYLKHNTGTEVITYTCVACFISSTSYPSFRGHCYTSHVIKDRFKCNNCNKPFSKLSALKDHIDTVHNFKCNKPDCNKKFPSKKELHVHQILHKDDANQPPYQCQTCSEEFENIPSCEDHIDKHFVFTYPCPLCEEELKKENAYKHLTAHYGEVITDNPTNVNVEETPEDSSINIVGGVMCCYCQELFKNRIEIDTHIADEHPDKDVLYTCVICHKHYEKYPLYGDHCYYHCTKNRFACDVCDKTFSRLSLLVVHAEVHKVESKLQDRQNETTEFRCRLCNLLLSDALTAQRHLSVHRRNQFTCPVCAREYAEKYLLMKHVPQHFEAVFHMCKVCGKMFAAKNRLIEHVKTHSSVKDYECKYCGKGFLKPYQLSQHLNVHTGARPYACVSCPKTFASQPNWLKHLRRMHNIDPKTLNKPVQDDIQPKNTEKPVLKQEPKVETFEVNTYVVEETKEKFDFCDDIIMEPVTIDSTIVEREAKRYEFELKSMNTNNDSIAELTPILPEDIDKFVSEMLGEGPAIIPREYGPDFGPEDLPLVHVAPQLVAGPPNAPPPSWEPPVITKVCSGYYGDLDLSFIDTDIF